MEIALSKEAKIHIRRQNGLCLRCGGWLYYEEISSCGFTVRQYVCINCGARYFVKKQIPNRIYTKYKECEICGTKIPYKTSHKKYCDKCLKRKKSLFRKEINCQRCGKVIIARHRQTKYCFECVREVIKEARRKTTMI